MIISYYVCVYENFQVITFDELKTGYKNPIDQCNNLNPVSILYLDTNYCSQFVSFSHCISFLFSASPAGIYIAYYDECLISVQWTILYSAYQRSIDSLSCMEVYE